MSEPISEETYLKHYGILRKSGRYPWGSGSDPEQRSRSFLGMVAELRDQGLTPVQIAKGFGMTTTELRATTSIARSAKKAADIAQAQMYKDNGYGNSAIARKMGINESSVRALLAPGAKDRSDRLSATTDMLREQVKEKGMIDIGKGNENQLQMSRNQLDTAVAVLRAEGYVVHNVQVPNIGSAGNKTLIKVLAPEGTEYKDIVSDIGKVKSIGTYSDDGGRSFSHIQPPVSISSKRVKVQYKEDTPSGADADGVIYVRPGKKDLDLGGASYAQVRIMIDGTHYLKGMAIYKDDLPDGVDLQFNTNKSSTGNKLDAMKPLKKRKDSEEVDMENPFGSIVRQIGDRDHPGGPVKKVTSAMNLVNEEGDWGGWSRNLSAQMLSKQKPSLITERLNETFASKKEGLDEILSLTNPVVKKKLLESYADDLDSAAIHLKAAGLPRQRTQVIIPINSLKDNEVYAPNFRHGETVVLVRYPHGGKFEIPELKVNNLQREARKILGKAEDAIGINSKVAGRLSGADFDGDTVVVIPNNNRKIKSEPALKGLKDFDPQRRYPGYEGMPKLSSSYKQKLMGDVSNLITDMTIKGAPNFEIEQAVKHSMVVIDAEKHNLNWRQSALDNNIASLKKKYQQREDGSSRGGASTLISQKKSPIRVPERKLQKASESFIDPKTGQKISGPIDPRTGKKIYRETGAEYVDKKTGQTVKKTTSVRKLEYYDDAHKLSSGTPQEKLYADHSNRLKDLANKTRLAALNTGRIAYSENAARVYAKEVAELKSALNIALQNSPRERQAQVVANARIATMRRDNPDIDKAELKKLQFLALSEARQRVGAKKAPISPTDEQWAAIQAGAVRHTTLKSILDNADLNRVKELATPHQDLKMNTSKLAKAERLLASGATQAEVADELGVSLSTLKRSLNG